MTIVAVTDTETTGLADNDQVCEFAVALIGVKEVGPPDKSCIDGMPLEEHQRHVWMEHIWTTLVKPSCTMSSEARATHHITDEELEHAPTMTELLLKRGMPEFGYYAEPQAPVLMGSISGLPPDQVVFCAHNAKFDRAMLVQSGVHESLLPARTICTWRCALHLYPDEPRHGNQMLRYSLKLEPLFKTIGPPHRALPDVAVTAALVVHMLETHSVDELVELSNTPVLLKKVGFGKYRGQLWSNLDAGMLRWILSRDFGEDEKFTARHWLNAKEGRRKPA